MSQRIMIDNTEVGGVSDTEIVERPVIIDDSGKVFLATPEMAELPVDQLHVLAKLAKGRIAYRKYRVTYREVYQTGTNRHVFCDHKNCFALADNGNDYCETHEVMHRA